MNKALIVATVLIVFGASLALATEKKVKLADVPAAVQQAIKDNTKDATLVGVAKDEEDGKESDDEDGGTVLQESMYVKIGRKRMKSTG